MRRAALILGLVLALLAAALWASGGLDALSRAVAAMQREAQTALAGGVRRLRAGDPGALAGLLALCFGYGLAHAAGPGHGKVLIGSYGVARRVRILPLAAVALAASLAQAAVAVVLVHAAARALGWSRDRMIGVSETVMAPVSQALIAGLGLWLLLRGVRHLRRRARETAHDHGHDQDHLHGAACGHAHGPTPDDLARASGWRDVVWLIAGIAMRPCAGALFLLILTLALGLGAAGIAGAFVMGLGTATVTIGVAIAAVWAREGALAALPGAAVLRALPLLEIGAGALLLVIGGRLVLAAV